MKWLCVFRHDWSQWSAPRDEESVVSPHKHGVTIRSYTRTARVQGRACYRCGTIQERIIRILGEKPRQSVV